MTVRVSVQAQPQDATSWSDLAREIERDGFDALYVADHVGTAASPFVALAAAAAVTDRISLGTCVVNAGLWEPLALASAVATLDLLSDGRAVLGLGAGHTPREWTAAGRIHPSAGQRVTRLEEVVEVTTALLRGDVISFEGEHVRLVDAELERPAPVRQPIPLMIGGNGDRVLTLAGRVADIAGVTGLGRTLADGHRHEVRWDSESVSHTIDTVRSAVPDGRPGPEIEALVQDVIVTDDASSAARALAEEIDGTSPDDLLASPFVWIGTVDQIAARLVDAERVLGITRYVVRTPARADARRVMDAMHGSN